MVELEREKGVEVVVVDAASWVNPHGERLRVHVVQRGVPYCGFPLNTAGQVCIMHGQHVCVSHGMKTITHVYPTKLIHNSISCSISASAIFPRLLPPCSSSLLSCSVNCAVVEAVLSLVAASVCRSMPREIWLL